MEIGETSRETKRLIEQVKASFSQVYLTLISIIQACVLGYLMFSLDAKWSEFGFTKLPVIKAVGAFLIVVTTWNEYMMGATAFRWIPRLRDAFIPFVLGISEFFVVRSIFSEASAWAYSVCLFCFVGFLAYVNMFDSARKEPENKVILHNLGKLPLITEVWSLTCALFFGLFGIVLQKFFGKSWLEYVAVLSFVLLLGAFLYRGVLYWKKIIGGPEGLNRDAPYFTRTK